MMKAKGFTLIEVLVALVILAVISLMGYRGLSALIVSESAITSKASQWEKIDQFLTEFENDFRYAAPRGGRDPGGLVRRAMEGVAIPRHADEGHLTLTRFAPGDGLSTHGMQRVAYRFEPGKIVLLAWPVLDAAPLTRPERIELIDGITSASARYLDADDRWSDIWPSSNRTTDFPRAIELTLNIEGVGVVSRLFAR